MRRGLRIKIRQSRLEEINRILSLLPLPPYHSLCVLVDGEDQPVFTAIRLSQPFSFPQWIAEAASDEALAVIWKCKLSSLNPCIFLIQ